VELRVRRRAERLPHGDADADEDVERDDRQRPAQHRVDRAEDVPQVARAEHRRGAGRRVGGARVGGRHGVVAAGVAGERVEEVVEEHREERPDVEVRHRVQPGLDRVDVGEEVAEHEDADEERRTDELEEGGDR